MERLKEETLEAERSVIDWRAGYETDKARQVIRECADVANFAMMVARNVAAVQGEHDGEFIS